MKCQHCHKELTKLTEVTPEKGAPEPGALHLCGFCGLVSVYQEDLSLRPITEEEWVQLQRDLPGIYVKLKRAQHRIHARNRLN